MKLYGKNPVLERLRARPGTIKELYLQKRIDLSEVVKAAKKAGLGFRSVDSAVISELCGKVHSQGVMAEVEEFSYCPFGDIVSGALGGKTIPVMLDGVTDPQNLGSVIRSLACIGGFSLVLPEYESAEVNETVLRVANGGENYLPVGRVKKIIHAVRKLKAEGVVICGAVVDGEDDIADIAVPGAMALVMGAEGKGIRPTISEKLDKKVGLSMKGAGLSFNVAVAAAIFCYEINRKRWKEKGPG